MKYYIQFTAGRGPTECALACKQVLNEFIKEISKLCLKLWVIDVEEDDLVGYRSVVVQIDDCPEEIKNKWNGTIKFISQKNFVRPNHKRKNWFVGCKFYEVDNTDIILDMKDVRIDTMRASGAGGQHVNRTESAVRLVHIPTGLSVVCQAQRSQIQNLKIAKEWLSIKINELNENKHAQDKKSLWSNHDALERGNEVLTFKGDLI